MKMLAKSPNPNGVLLTTQGMWRLHMISEIGSISAAPAKVHPPSVLLSLSLFFAPLWWPEEGSRFPSSEPMSAIRGPCASCSLSLLHVRSTTSAISSARTVSAQPSTLGGPGPSTLEFWALRASTTVQYGRRHLSSTSLRHAPKKAANLEPRKKIDMAHFPPERIRNLSIIAHIDHGKSTLADRLLQMTNTVPMNSNPQFLDKLKVERERGITVKAQTVSIIHKHDDGQDYLINLIDTPGHVDFSYEVSRSLGACEGALILVDCTQGIQAQTLSVFHVAQEAGLSLLPVINKVDLPHASPEETSDEIVATLGLPAKDHMYISAKSGQGVDQVLKQIIEGLPAPRPWAEADDKLRALVFDTHYDHFRGVIALVRIMSGSLSKGDRIRFLQAGKKYDVADIGLLNPDEVPVTVLQVGQVGYLVCNMKNSEEAFIGDTVCLADKIVEPLPGFKPMRAMVFAGVFPAETADFDRLEEAIERLTLNDRSVSMQRETSAALSQGFRLGFLGTLHMDVFRQRLEDEYSSNVIITAPTVPHKVVYSSGKEVFISNPTEFPDLDMLKSRVSGVEEPMVNATIFVPNEYIGPMMDLASRYRGTQLEFKVLDLTGRTLLRYRFPLAEIVTDFFSELKSKSSGFASFDYEDAGYEASQLVKLNIMLNGQPVDALAMIVHRPAAPSVGREWCKKLKEVVPRQQYEVAVQAAIGTRVVARETINAFRKDVTAGLYGGHYERKMKHLEKQKEGKKRLKRLAGNIDIPQSAFFEVLSSRPRSFTTCSRQSVSLDVSGSGAQPQLDIPSSPLRKSSKVDPISLHLPLMLPPARDAESSPPYTDLARRRSSSGILTPEARSTKLSSIYRSTTSQPDTVTSGPLYDEYRAIADNSPLQLTPREIHSVMRTMLKLDRRHHSGRNVAAARISEALRDLHVVDSSDAALEVKILHLLHITRQQGKAKQYNFYRIIERELEHLLNGKAVLAGERMSKQQERIVAHMLSYVADKGWEDRFQRWWQYIKYTPKTKPHLARLILARRAGQLDAMPAMLENSLCKVKSSRSNIHLVNEILLAFAIAGRWDVVASIYGHLLPETCALVVGPLNGRRHDIFVLPNELGPSRRTFGTLIMTLSFAGHLEAALAVMHDMQEAEHDPHVFEYISLFEGFARHGRIAASSAGEAINLFPRLSQYIITDPQSQSEERQRASTHWATSIWSRRLAPKHSAWRNQPTQWTSSIFDELFHAFLKVSSNAQGVPQSSRAPGVWATWITLLAAARLTNGDTNSVKDVWEAMTRKFGPDGNTWRRSRLDGRLERLQDGLYGEKTSWD